MNREKVEVLVKQSPVVLFIKGDPGKLKNKN